MNSTNENLKMKTRLGLAHMYWNSIGIGLVSCGMVLYVVSSYALGLGAALQRHSSGKTHFTTLVLFI
jgi:hypothetical protein